MNLGVSIGIGEVDVLKTFPGEIELVISEAITLFELSKEEGVFGGDEDDPPTSQLKTLVCVLIG